MKRISTILAIGFGCVAVVAAQTPQPSPQTSAKASSDSTITLTGCLQRGDQAGAVGTTGTAGAPSRTQSEAGNSAQFILTNAKSASSTESNRPAGAPPTSSATAGTAGTSGARYVLEPGSSQSDLTTNVGKRVEVTGTIDTSTPSATATSAAGTASASASAGPKFKVASVRVIGSDCSSDQ